MAAPPALPSRPPRAKQLVTVKYDPEPRRDWIRAGITLGLIAALLGLMGFALYSTHADYEKTMVVLDKLLPALTGLIGSALGFYFGSKNSQS